MAPSLAPEPGGAGVPFGTHVSRMGPKSVRADTKCPQEDVCAAYGGQFGPRFLAQIGPGTCDMRLVGAGGFTVTS